MLSTWLSNVKRHTNCSRPASITLIGSKFRFYFPLLLDSANWIEMKTHFTLREFRSRLEIHQINRPRACFYEHVMELENFFFNFKPNGRSFMKVFLIAVEFQSRLCTLAGKRRRQKEEEEEGKKSSFMIMLCSRREKLQVVLWCVDWLMAKRWFHCSR